MSSPRPSAMNLAGVVEHPQAGPQPYEVSIDGLPYLPVGNAGVVLGVELGDPVDAFAADQVIPGVSVIHPDQAARHALTSLSCVGNAVVVRGGAAAGEHGHVIGKRGEAGQVIVRFEPEVLARLRPGDGLSVRAFGQGAGPADPCPDGVEMLNLDPGLLPSLPIGFSRSFVEVGVRMTVASRVCGNGVGRPAQGWDIALALAPQDAGELRLGDLVAVTDLDVRANMGYRRGWLTVGTIVCGTSPLPGHGPGLLPLLTGPAAELIPRVEHDHAGLTPEALPAPPGVTDRA